MDNRTGKTWYTLARRLYTPVIQELINRADRRGYVTFEDVLEILEEEGDDAHALDTLLDQLDELGIELRQEDSGREEPEEAEEETESEDDRAENGIGDINAVSPDDPVGLYFRQMAQEPLLTRVGRN